jgi:hypothetical protein
VLKSHDRATSRIGQDDGFLKREGYIAEILAYPISTAAGFARAWNVENRVHVSVNHQKVVGVLKQQKIAMEAGRPSWRRQRSGLDCQIAHGYGTGSQLSTAV